LPGCANQGKQEQYLRDYTDLQLTQSIKILQQYSGREYQDIENKRKDPMYTEIITRLTPRITAARTVTEGILAYLEKEENRVNREHKPLDTDSLLLRLDNYEKQLYKIDSGFSYIFKNELRLLDENSSFIKKQQILSYFKHSPYRQSASFLLALQHKVVSNENKIINYINSRYCRIIIEYFTKTSVIAGQNYNHLKSGEEIEITAGVGEFSVTSKPSFRIGNKKVEPENAVANYRQKVYGPPGRYSIPLKIEYTDESGIRQKYTRQVMYYIDP